MKTSRGNTRPLSGIARKLIKDLEENIYCRLQPSGTHGIGVFAIRDIPKGKELFKTFLNYQLTPVPYEMILRNPKIDPAVKRFVHDVSPVLGGEINLYRAGLNAVDISFFLNHSERPNVTTEEDSGVFLAGRKIKKGEELFSDHRTYSGNVTY